jgi:lysophospholipid acyltransferase (LPLAT)-like uncharacterized protein
MSKQSKTKIFFKKIKTNSHVRTIAGYLVYMILRALFTTYRLRVSFDGSIKQPLQDQFGIFYFWHQSIISGMFFFFKNKNHGSCVVSPSNDGQIVGFVCQKMGFRVVSGSSSKKPLSLVKKMLDLLKEDRQICLVGDGSRGPAFQRQRGLKYLANKTSLETIFIECKPRWKITFKNSWDKFQLPIPFSKIFIHVHKPSKPDS